MNFKQSFFKLFGKDMAVPIRLKNRLLKSEDEAYISSGLQISKVLKDARTQSGQELKDVANILKIRHDYLESIEAGHYHSLPGPAYTIGFIKSYASYLRLDVQQLIHLFKTDSNIQEPTNTSVFPSSAPEGKIPSVIVIFSVVFIAGTIFFGWASLNKSKLITPNHSGLISKTILETKIQPITSFLGPQSKELIPKSKEVSLVINTAIETKKHSEKIEKDKDQKQYNEKSIRKNIPINNTVLSPAALTKSPFSLEQKTTDKVAQKKYIAPPSPQKTSLPLKEITKKPTNNLSIEATADSWVQIQASESDIIFSRVLKTGERYDVPNRNDLYLTTGNIGALIIKLNGKIVSKSARLNRVAKNIALDQKNFIKDQPNN